MPQIVKRQFVSRDGEWVPVAVDSSGEVVVHNDQPAGVETDLWVDLDGDSPVEGHVAAADPHPQYISEDALVVKDHPLLREAFMWTDASAATGGALVDLSGRNNDVKFITKEPNSAPVVLTHFGEDYVFFPPRADAADVSVANVLHSGATAPVAAGITDVVLEADIILYKFSTDSYTIVLNTSTALGTVRLNISKTGEVYVVHNNVTAAASAAGSIVIGDRSIFRAVVSATATSIYKNGALLISTATPYVGTTAGETVLDVGYGTRKFYGRIYSASLSLDGEVVHKMSASNHNADYSEIANTGTAGGVFTVGRAADGFKTSVVDRPLVALGGDHETSGGSPMSRGATFASRDRSWLIATRRFGDPSRYHTHAIMDLDGTVGAAQGLDMYMVAGSTLLEARIYSDDALEKLPITSTWGDGQAVLGVTSGSSGSATYLNGVRVASSTTPVNHDDFLTYEIGCNTSMEYLAAATFDRVLSDAEMAQASEEILVPYPITLAEMDTGWRLLTSTLENGWTEYNTAGTYPPCVRRYGDVVNLTGLIFNAASVATNLPMLTLPYGFRPAKNIYMFTNKANVAQSMGVYSNGLVVHHGAHTGATNKWISLHATWTTHQEWPAVMPGEVYW